MTSSNITVVGINASSGASAQDTFTTQAQKVLASATVVIGAKRQLDLVAEWTPADLVELPRPLLPGLDMLLATHTAQPMASVVVLASGDPMFYGIGATVRRLGYAPLVLPVPSSASLACARLGWALQHTEIYSLVTAPVDSLAIPVAKGMPFLVLGRDEHTPSEVRRFVPEETVVEVLHNLGAEDERRVVLAPGTQVEPMPGLNILAVTPQANQTFAERPPAASLAPGLPDDCYEHDGQLTKSHVRALAIAALRPMTGDVLWDIGGGSGSVAIEFLRVGAQAVSMAAQSPHQCRAVVFERNPERAERIQANAATLGVSTLLSVQGAAPEAFAKALESPTAVFIGGGLTIPGVFEQAWERLRPGGRLVANAVTIETQARLFELRKQFGGELHHFAISHEHAIGSFTALRPALGVHQWYVEKN
ncbi:precorrin-6y C5,15-methyltransferase (decarboxylating) subunit CbiE [Corynebacterium sp. 35RC1]|nr:precorrin-6y C5,15-methyltransferase (decarboxylating) subunit CbiE [Corynebacterium sp. 35RC1]